ncbi:MAG: hypothetical protein LW807_05745 [Proteobacteria bacterium]|jgi:hypothetical protein|nr:hypothetical protein [Pseudomonadota bacterium]
MGKLLNKLIQFWIDALCKGVLLRGGITKGLLHHNKNKVFGDALIDAYELESKVANYPRIIISKKLINIINVTEDEVSAPMFKYTHQLGAYITLDNDGIYMLSYFHLFGLLYVSNKMNIFKTAINDEVLNLQENKDLNKLNKWQWINHQIKKHENTWEGCSHFIGWGKTHNTLDKQEIDNILSDQILEQITHFLYLVRTRAVYLFQNNNQINQTIFNQTFWIIEQLKKYVESLKLQTTVVNPEI